MARRVDGTPQSKAGFDLRVPEQHSPRKRREDGVFGLGRCSLGGADSEGGIATTQKAPGTIRSCKRRIRKGGDYGVVFDRITVDPEKMGGVPSIRGLRIPVATVVGMVADGMGEEEILRAYPDLEREDVREALRYAAEAVREREIPLV